MNDRTEHLNEEELDEVLMGLGGSDVEAHVEGCAVCREKVAQFRVEMAGLEKASLAWNQARSNSMPAVVVGSSRGVRRFGIAAMSVACLLVVMLVVMIGERGRMGRRGPAAVANSSAGAGIKGGELHEDNALMVAINEETAPIASPLDAYHQSTRVSVEGNKKGERARP